MNMYKVKRYKSGQLFLFHDNRWIEVEIVRCFPWSDPEKYISLKDKEGIELYFIEDLTHLEGEERKIIQTYLEELGFSLTITRVQKISEEVALRKYQVDTSSGERTFYTKLEDWPTTQQDGRIIIKDLSGDHYEVPDLSRLNKESRKRLSYLIG